MYSVRVVECLSVTYAHDDPRVVRSSPPLDEQQGIAAGWYVGILGIFSPTPTPADARACSMIKTHPASSVCGTYNLLTR